MYKSRLISDVFVPVTTFGVYVVVFSSVFSIAVFAIPAGMLSFGCV